MNKVFNILAILASIFGALLVGYLIYGLATNGFTDGTGMAILVFQLYGAIGAGVGLFLSLIGLWIGKKKGSSGQGIGKFALILAILTFLSLGASSFIP